jgi:LPS export ABC transporter protein LptC
MMGSVLLTRAAAGNEPALRLSTEYLLALPDLDRFSTDKPVEMERGDSTIKAQSMLFDNVTRTIDFQGSVRANFVPPPAAGAKP